MANEQDMGYIIVGEEKASGAYSEKRFLYKSIKRIEGAVYTTEVNSTLPVSVLEKAKERTGGIIILPEDDSKERMLKTNVINRVKNAVAEYNAFILERRSKVKEGVLAAWTEARALSGTYKAKNGVIFGSESYSVDIIGMINWPLHELVEEISLMVPGKTVMCKDYTNHNVCLIGPKNVLGSDKKTDQ
jgi:hypothetical protein